MIRLLLLLLLVLPASARAAAPVAAPAPGLSAVEARQALAVLRDPRQRLALEHTLEAIAKVEAGKAPPAAAPASAAASTPATGAKPPVQLNPNGLGAAVLVGASGFLNRLSAEVVATLHAAQSLPLLWGWLVVMATNPLAQSLLRQAAWRVVAVLVLALAAETAVRRLLRRPLAAIERQVPANGKAEASAGGAVSAGEVAGEGAPGAEPPQATGAGDAQTRAGAGDAQTRAEAGDAQTRAEAGDAEARAEAGEIEPPLLPRRPGALALLRRLPAIFAHFLLDLLPVAGFVLVGHIAAATPLGGPDQARLVVLATIDATALAAAILCFFRMLFSPPRPGLRLFPVSGRLAAWAMRWLRRIVIVAVAGYGIGQVGLLLGLSQPAYEGLLKIAGLINHVFVAVMILQQRRAVRSLLRAPEGAAGPVARLRNALAPIWHWIALFALAADWLVWAIELRHDYSAVLRALVLAVLMVVATRLALIVLTGSLDRAVRLRPEAVERYPGLAERLAFYHPLTVATVRGAVYVAATVLLLELLGVGLIGWLTGTSLGQRLASGFGTIGFTVLAALVAWEAANIALQRQVARLTRDQHAARAARLRTLLPLLRATLFVVIGAIAGLTVLSQIGIDIAPLLAGAGILGVAIGFGSQKLVQDLITGIFLLLENAMQVGDWVTVSGLSGAVENLSVRTIRLRAADGSVHIIPFSAVTSVTNTNRGLGNAAVGVTVSYAEDTDRVMDTLREIAAGMRKEPEFSGRMLTDIQLWGVDKVDGAAVTIAGQIPCTDAGRWPVQREFNRRVKRRFQELGIALFNPAQTMILAPSPTPAAREALAAPGAPAALPRPEAAQ